MDFKVLLTAATICAGLFLNTAYSAAQSDTLDGALENPNSLAEEAEALEGDTNFTFDSFNVGLTYFHGDYLNYLELRQVEPVQSIGLNGIHPRNLVVRRYYNSSRVSRLRGLEGNVQWHMGRQFGWNFDLEPYLAFTQIYRFNPFSRKLTLISDSTYNYGITFTDTEDDIGVSIDATHFGNQTMSNGYTFGPFTVLDIHFGKNIIGFDNQGTIRLLVDVYNLTNELSEEQSIYWKTGRSVYVGLRYDY
ncbi:MAG: hypothetical protein LBE38_06160 [Deltaproteobacteria bacterium]|jgi:outer membrane receptor protein involved in Fe transport|nr:hypothetical protein [Deltaproteobacteria bacterium]